MASKSVAKLEARKGIWLVALSGMLYGLIGFFGTRLLREGFNVPQMLFWRFFAASVYMALFLMLTGKRKKARKRPENKRKFWHNLFFAVLAYSSATTLYFWASQRIGTGLGMVIFFSFPVFVTLYALLFSSWRMNRYAFSSLLAVVAGMLLIKGHGNHALTMTGFLLALGSASLYAAYIFGSQHSAKAVDTGTQTFLLCLGNALVFLIFACMVSSFKMPATLMAWIDACALGVFATALPVQLLLEGLKRVSAIKVAILSVLEPVVTVLVGVFFLHEQLVFMQYIGILIVLLGAILIQFEKTPELVEDKLL